MNLVLKKTKMKNSIFNKLPICEKDTHIPTLSFFSLFLKIKKILKYSRKNPNKELQEFTLLYRG